jgi:hypothetical protein
MLLVEEHIHALLQIETAHVNETSSLCHIAEGSLWAYLKGVLV